MVNSVSVIGTRTRPRLDVALALLTVYVIWGSTYLAIRFAIATLPPFLMAGTRFTLAGALLYGWMRLRGAPRPSAANWRAALVIGALLLVGANGVVSWAEQRVPSGIAALIIATVPLWMALLDWLRPGGIRPRVQIALGLLCGFAGVALLIGPRNWSGSAVDLVGAGAVVFASFSWAVGSLYSRRAELPASALLATSIEMLAAGMLLLLVGTAGGEWARLDPGQVSLHSALALGYLVVFGSLIAFSAYVWLLRATTPAIVSTYAYVNPVVALVLGWALAGEALTPRTLLASAVIVAGVVIITTQRAGTTPAPGPPEAGLLLEKEREGMYKAGFDNGCL
ncbi:MAG TPA: drug/metabolite exporter YedA [Ardenticatenaceae bacterium]|nr:drug/metabolite exporter YedA [Ardenticatenaceae bacterium]